jgi:hypothetical protein
LQARSRGLPAIAAAATTAATTTAATTVVATTTAATTPTTATATTTTAAAAAASRAILGDVNAERTTLEILTIEIVEGLLRTLLRRHLDEAEAARAARHPIQHQGNLANLAARGKPLLDEIFGGVKREVTNVQTIRHFGHFSLAASNWMKSPSAARRTKPWIALNENAGRV